MLRPHPKALRAAAPLALAAILAAHPAFAATPSTYIGPDLGLWTNPANWSANSAPAAGDDLGASSGIVAIDLNGGRRDRGILRKRQGADGQRPRQREQN